MKILVVDDEKALTDTLARGLALKGFPADTLYDGKSAFTRIALHAQDYDLIILDLMLPEMSGGMVTEALRERGVTVPIIILTAQSDTETKVALLRSGADDYLVKPFSFDELLARIQAILRRPKDMLPTQLSAGELTLDPVARTITIGKTPLFLTLKEYMLLEYMMRHPSETITREELLSHLWDFNYDGFSNVIDVHVKNLRKKLGEAGGQNMLEAVRGVGYRLRV